MIWAIGLQPGSVQWLTGRGLVLFSLHRFQRHIHIILSICVLQFANWHRFYDSHAQCDFLRMDGTLSVCNCTAEVY